MEIRPGIHWVGVRDPDLRVFDVIIPTEFGSTYNSYLIDADEPALIDGVKLEFQDEFFAKLAEKIDLTDLKHLVVNHTEPDHSGSIKELLKRAPHLTVHGSRAAIQFLGEQVNMEFNKHIVGEGDVLDLGNRKLRFIMAPFLHWPDTMWTYLEEEEVLFTCDGFGSHFCFPEGKIFASEQEMDFTDEIVYYFDAIMGPFKPKVQEAVAKLEGLPLKMIATGHGPILDENLDQKIQLYKDLSATVKQGRKRVVVGYASAYGHTRRMAELVAEGARQKPGVDVTLIDVGNSTDDQIKEAISSFDAIVLGSPTINADAVYPIWRVIDSLSAITSRGKIAATFGNYGWSGEAAGLLEERLEKMRLAIAHPAVKARFGLTDEDEQRCRELGSNIAEAVS
mgnify:FL=1